MASQIASNMQKNSVSFSKGKLAHVNFIPYNPGEGTDSNGYLPTTKIIIKKFQNTLDQYGIPFRLSDTLCEMILMPLVVSSHSRKSEYL